MFMYECINLLVYLFIREAYTCFTVSTKILSTTVFNIDNNNGF